jgi:hypothetical protein
MSGMCTARRLPARTSRPDRCCRCCGSSLTATTWRCLRSGLQVRPYGGGYGSRSANRAHRARARRPGGLKLSHGGWGPGSAACTKRVSTSTLSKRHCGDEGSTGTKLTAREWHGTLPSSGALDGTLQACQQHSRMRCSPSPAPGPSAIASSRQALARRSCWRVRRAASATRRRAEGWCTSPWTRGSSC